MHSDVVVKKRSIMSIDNYSGLFGMYTMYVFRLGHGGFGNHLILALLMCCMIKEYTHR